MFGSGSRSRAERHVLGETFSILQRAPLGNSLTKGVRRCLDLVDGLAHRDTATGPAQHLDVVAPVADRQDVGSGEADPVAHVLEAGGLRDADR